MWRPNRTRPMSRHGLEIKLGGQWVDVEDQNGVRTNGHWITVATPGAKGYRPTKLLMDRSNMGLKGRTWREVHNKLLKAIKKRQEESNGKA